MAGRLTTDSEIDANPPQSDHSVVVLNAEQVHHHQDDGDQDVDERERVEKLGGDEKRWNVVKKFKEQQYL